MLKVIVPVKDEILRAAERRKAAGVGEDINQFLAELINLSNEEQCKYEHRLGLVSRLLQAVV